MKHLSIIIILGLVGISFAEETPRDEPAELLSLRHNFDQAKNNAIQPITKYLSLLEELKKKYTKAGNLDSALAVEAELKLIRVQVDDVKKSNIVPTPTTKEELVEYLLERIGSASMKKTKRLGSHNLIKMGRIRPIGAKGFRGLLLQSELFKCSMVTGVAFSHFR